MSFYQKWFSRPKFLKWNLFLLNLAYKGLGIDQWKSIETSGEKNFLKDELPKDCRTIFDVGAFHGSYSKTARMFHPNAHIFAFEPHPKSFKHLSKTATEAKFYAYPLGLGSTCEKKRLYDSLLFDGSSQASLLEEKFDRCKTPTCQHDVQLSTIDQFCKEQAIEQIDLLKIDAEGMEYDVLLGAERMIGSLSVRIIQFEINQLSLLSKKTLFDFMELLSGYDFYRMLYHGLLPLERNKLTLFAVSDHQNIIAWSQACSQNPNCSILVF